VAEMSAVPPTAERPTLFIDRCAWSGALGRALESAGIPFVPHHRQFAHDATDEQWLGGVAGTGWHVVTRDQRIRYKLNELRAMVAARLHLFVFTQGGLTAAQTGDLLVRAYPAIVKAVRERPPPVVWSIRIDGTVAPLRLKLG
jgi:hypothetical protein